MALRLFPTPQRRCQQNVSKDINHIILSSETHYLLHFKGPHIAVFGGATLGNNADISLCTNSTSMTPWWPPRVDTGQRMRWGIGRFVDEGFLVCQEEYSQECKHLKLGATTWTPVPGMQQRRLWAGCTNIGNRFWVTGGQDSFWPHPTEIYKTTELCGGKWIQGIDLPEERSGHCMTNLSEDKASQSLSCHMYM